MDLGLLVTRTALGRSHVAIADDKDHVAGRRPAFVSLFILAVFLPSADRERPMPSPIRSPVASRKNHVADADPAAALAPDLQALEGLALHISYLRNH